MSPAEQLPLDFSALLSAFDDKIKLTYTVGPNREGRLEVDGTTRMVRIHWPSADANAILSRYRNLQFEQHEVNSKVASASVLEIDASKSPSAALAFATSVIATLTGGRTALASGVLAAIAEWNEIIEEFQLLSRSRQVGLVGELLFLLHLTKTFGPEKAITSWLGPPRSEHDFAIDECEIEVKTTESERRVHTVASETQLCESRGRELYLLSIQLTRAGDSKTGVSLSDLVVEARELMVDYESKIDSRLVEAGWDDRFAELYTEKLMFRSRPRLFLVGNDFPRITRDVLDENIYKGNLLSRVSYKIDLSSMKETPALQFVRGFGENE